MPARLMSTFAEKSIPLQQNVELFFINVIFLAIIPSLSGDIVILLNSIRDGLYQAQPT